MRPPHFPEALKKKEPAELVAYAVLIAGMIFVLMQLLTTYTGYSFYEYRRIENGISGELVRTDGRTLRFRGNSFPVPRSGDTLIVRVPLSRENHLLNSALSFCWTGAVVTASDPEGNLLFSYGENMEAEGHQIGDVLCIIPLPESAWEHFVTLTLRQAQGRGAGHFHSLRITRTANAIHYALVRYLVEFVLFITCFWTALVCTVLFGIAAVRRPGLRQWFWFSAFCAASSGWVIGYLHFINAISRWSYLAANSAYISVCIMPAAVSMFLSRWPFPPKICRFYRRSALLFTAFFAAAVLFELFTPLHYYHFMGPLCTLVFIHILLTAYVLLRVSPAQSNERPTMVLKWGLLASCLFLLLELIRFSADRLVDRPGPAMRLFLSINMAPAFVFLTILSFLLNSILMLFHQIMESREKENLKKIAWIDPLSAIPNRQACVRRLEELEQKEIRNYTLYFFDADNLKKANDTYGHDMGDELIIFVAHSVRNTFEDYPGFFGRWGGDEFIACVIGSIPPEDPIATFRRNIEEGNQYHFFPFHASVSQGWAVSTAEAPLTPKEALEEADRRMYEHKRQAKASRRSFPN
ncbi:GGDEF domain-containing protein [Lachnoclostridium sp. Marseille-P6806]|uniref:GGDEF domain-containing protein n=1 Tax=Lachnoclostridium sp. Marseille-P6806 TaxID=2364793 RepID=UPI0013EEFA8B|nr:GGDEF domain-containing protein [Lachnoclostridium sp. Marseille-P6806]